MPPDDTPSYPMLKVYADIGQITKGIANLEKGQDRLTRGQEEVESKVSTLHQRLSDLVTSEECDERHGDLVARVDAAAACAGAAKQKVHDQASQGILGRIAKNAGDLTKILTLLVTLGIGLYAVHRFVVRVEAAMSETAGEQARATSKLIRKLDNQASPPVVYVPIVVAPDAGPPPRARRKRAIR